RRRLRQPRGPGPEPQGRDRPRGCRPRRAPLLTTTHQRRRPRMANDGQVSASDQTLQAANALNGEIDQLDEQLQQILTTGNSLADNTEWHGPHRDNFAEAWAGQVTTNLNKSIEALHQMDKDAQTSANDIQRAGGKGGIG